MFTVAHQNDRINPVKAKKFSGLGFITHLLLQELLELQPDAPSEELLIFPKAILWC